MDHANVIPEAADKVFTQDYSPTPKIDGVEFIELKEFADCGGSFMELLRITDGKSEVKEGFEPRQINYSVVQPGAVKAFHLHFRQNEFWFIPPAMRMLMGLYDVRNDSPTKGNQMRFVLGAHKPRLLYIPAGVAHGTANIGTAETTIIYVTDQQFNLENLDEQRLPWNTLGDDFWKIKFE